MRASIRAPGPLDEPDASIAVENDNGHGRWTRQAVHVKAEPQWDLMGSSFPEFFSPEEWEDIKTYPGWEELIKPTIPDSVSKEWRREHSKGWRRQH